MARGKKTDQRGRSQGVLHHVRVFSWMIKLPAWKALSGNAAKLYVEMSSLYYGENNGEIFMSVRSAAERLDVSSNTARKAIDDLIEKGFIKPFVKGSFHRKIRHATTWILTEHEYNGRLPTRDFTKWRPKENTDANKKGICIKKNDRKPMLSQNLSQTVSDIETELRLKQQESVSEIDTQISYHGRGDV